MEILISLLVVVAVVILLYWLFGKAPAPFNLIGQIVVICAGCIWLIAHIPQIVHAIANG